MTLMEIMIVMALIAMILGAVAWNYQGALDDGRAFETKANIEKVRTFSIYVWLRTLVLWTIWAVNGKIT